MTMDGVHALMRIGSSAHDIQLIAISRFSPFCEKFIAFPGIVGYISVPKFEYFDL
jgi:hypothetical protein